MECLISNGLTNYNLDSHIYNINIPISTLGPNIFCHHWKSIEVYKHKGKLSSNQCGTKRNDKVFGTHLYQLGQGACRAPACFKASHLNRCMENEKHLS
jgi:hypothetical protein